MYSNAQFIKREYVTINLYLFKLSMSNRKPRIITVETAVIMGLSIIKVLKLIRKSVYINEGKITFVKVESLKSLNTENEKNPFIRYLKILINKSHSKNLHLI